jgi:hypothetical protein
MKDRSRLLISTISAWKSRAISRDNGSSSLLGSQSMAMKLRARDGVHGQAINTVAGTVKIKIPDTLAHRPDDLPAATGPCVVRLLAKRLAGVSSRIIKRIIERSSPAFPQPFSFPRHRCVLLLPVRAAHASPSHLVSRRWPLGRLPFGRPGDGPSGPPPAFRDEGLEDAHATA